MSNYLTIIGQRIREVRKAKGWTQVDLAGVADCTVITIKRAEAGQQNLGINTLTDIAKGLGVELTDLMKLPIYKGQVPEIGFPEKTENRKSAGNQKPKSQKKPKTENPDEIRKLEIQTESEIENRIDEQFSKMLPESETQNLKGMEEPETGSTSELEIPEKPKTQKPLKIRKW